MALLLLLTCERNTQMQFNFFLNDLFFFSSLYILVFSFGSFLLLIFGLFEMYFWVAIIAPQSCCSSLSFRLMNFSLPLSLYLWLLCHKNMATNCCLQINLVKGGHRKWNLYTRYATYADIRYSYRYKV